MSGALVEIDLGTELGPHLADRRAEAAGAAVGDRAEEPPVASLEDHVEDHLLGDRVADLDGAAGDGLALAGQLGRAEGGAVDAVAAGPAADRDDPVAGLDALLRHAARHHADRPAEDQRVGQVARVDGQGAVDGGNPHPVAVVADAGDDPLEHALGMKHAGRQRAPAARSGGATQKTSVLQIGLAPRPVPSASRITPPSPVLAPP